MRNEAHIKKEDHECVTTTNNYDWDRFRNDTNPDQSDCRSYIFF